MKRMLPYLNLIIAYPPTWLALGVVIVGELGIAVWFQPPALILAVAILIGIILLALWPMVLIRSPQFVRDAIQKKSLEDFVKRLEGCYPSFGPPAMDCWTVAERIKQEFGARGFGDEVESAMAKLIKLTENHVKFHSLSQQFGDAEQKKEMHSRLLKHVARVENTKTSLLVLGGKLAILEFDVATKEEIG